MIQSQKAVFFFENDDAITEDSRPLMLEVIHSRPILYWIARGLLASGMEHFFTVCPPRFAEEARACFPEGTDVIISEQHKDLMDFLETDEYVFVLPRAGIPMKAAGAGFAYTAPGNALKNIWQFKMTNAIQEAQLVPGWIPIFSKDTIAELEPIFNPDNENLN